MHGSRLRRIIGIVLGLWLALGMSASVVQASQMAVKMAGAYSASAGDDGACDGCGNDGSGMKMSGCGAALCVTSVVAALPQIQTLTVVSVDDRELPLPTVALLVGSTPSPEPYPPRFCNLG